MEIRAPLDTEELLSVFHLIREIPFTDITPEECLSRCLTGQYTILLGFKSDELVGLVTYHIKDTFCFVAGLYCKNNLKAFPDLFFEKLKTDGVITVRASTRRAHKAYEKLIGMKKIWSVYERSL